ncbi:T9SS type A sorting domain-containing protein [bacterium]|nr:T9SS type A sorting domain-containing protein [bacterium]MBU1984461.1 T9SS type A sorting domain-containing protein [bacterium]
MKRSFFAIAILLLFTTVLFAQPRQGAVDGLVMDVDRVPVGDAMVFLSGVSGGHGHHMPHFRIHTRPDGSFGFPNIPAGPYTISAHHPRVGFAAELIEVFEGQTTHVNLVLRNRPPEHPDSLVIVELAGTAIVVQPDSAHPRMARYFLDVDNDGEPDYALSFGPPWYNPPNENTRPENGDEITVMGGLLTHTDPPVVVVFELNGLFWRDPRGGHGGHGGGDHWRRGCNPDSITVVDLEGAAIVRTGEGFHGEWTRYFLNADDDSLPEFILDFGGPDYVPPSEATRPEDGDIITIVGGQLYCPNHPPDAPAIVIVYEINGMLWRMPGDTAGLGTLPLSVGEPVAIGAPVSYLTAHNYPNPFNPSTTINYSIPMAGDVRVAVYDITGREVAELVNRYQNSGSYAVHFDGNGLASGIYFYRVSAAGQHFTSRMVLMK